MSSQMLTNGISANINAGIKQILDLQKQTDEKITQLNPKNQNSTLKGQWGEFALEEFLINRFKYGYTVENTTKTPNSGDFIIEKIRKGSDIRQRMIIDIKNRTTNVPTHEQDKFKRDLNVQNVKIGILASLETGFSNFGILDCEVVEDGKQVVIYLGNLKSNYELLEMAIHIGFVLHETLDAHFKKQKDNEELKRVLEQLSETFKLIEDFQKMKKSLSEAVDAFETRLKSELNKLKNIHQAKPSPNKGSKKVKEISKP
jgi:hypothetical protein